MQKFGCEMCNDEKCDGKIQRCIGIMADAFHRLRKVWRDWKMTSCMSGA